MLIEKVEDTIQKYNLLRPGDRVLVAVSGGIDSVTLLFILNSLKDEYHLRLSIAHLNHMMRKKESMVDERFVKDLSKRMHIPITVERINVPKLIKQSHLSPEECARQIRYDFLIGLARLIGFNKVAIAHHKDDQVETVLMRLLRGSGLRGLSGITPKRFERGVWIIRPLIEIEKSEIIKFGKKRNIHYRQDSSNLKDIYLRNKIRNSLIPILEKDYNPRIKHVLANLADNITSDYQYLQEITNEKYNKIALKNRDICVVSLKRLLREHTAIRRMILRRAIAELKGNLDSISYRHWKELEECLASGVDSFKINLPKNIFIKREKDLLKIYRQNKIREIKREKPARLKIPGGGTFGNYRFQTKLISKKIRIKKTNKDFEYFDFEKIKLPLMIRFWKKADKIRPLGMKGKKKLHDLFIDEKIASTERDKIPLIVSKNKILWVCGIRMSDDVKIIDSTKKILKIEFKKIHSLT